MRNSDANDEATWLGLRTNDSTILKQGFERQLIELIEIQQQCLDNFSMPPRVCAACFQLESDCVCSTHAFWDLNQVIEKLRHEFHIKD